MKFDQLIHMLIPHDEKFFTLLEESTQNLLNAAGLLKKLTATKGRKEIDVLVAAIKDLEHKGDSVTHRIFSELNATFVTPLDREDIHQLTSVLDDILDHIDGSVTRVSLYNIKKFPKEMITLSDVLYKSIEELHRGVGLLRDLQQFDRLQDVFHKVNQYENDADSVFERAIADLFKNERNPIQIIKLKEVYVGLETATDKCEDAANVLEGILIKQA